MPADPIVWTPDTKPGHIKHSFTGLRPAFPNRGLHFVIIDRIIPLRKQLLTRSEKQQPGRWEKSLATYAQEGLESINAGIQHMRHDADTTDLKTLEVRRQERDAFIKRAGVESLEKLAADKDATHTDELLGGTTPRIASVHFDYTGLKDPNMAQATPARVQNSDMRSLIIELDGLVVAMSNSPSADHPRTINEHDAAAFTAALADLFKLVDRAASLTEPYHPSGTLRGQYDDGFNADASFDPEATAGGGLQGESVNAATGGGTT